MRDDNADLATAARVVAAADDRERDVREREALGKKGEEYMLRVVYWRGLSRVGSAEKDDLGWWWWLGVLFCGLGEKNTWQGGLEK